MTSTMQTPRDRRGLRALRAFALRQPETLSKLETVGFDPMIGGPEELAALLKSEMARAAKVVADAGIKPD